jgi:hypothetical protein
MSKIFKYSDISADKITFGVPKTLDNGGKIIGVYHEGKPLIIQTPNMISRFGLTKFEGTEKYTIDVQFQNTESNPALESFLQTLKDIDEKFVEEGVKNSSTWLKKGGNSPRVVIEALYTSVVKYSKNSETGEITNAYPPSMRIQLPFRNGKFTCDVYDSKRDLIDISDINTKNMAMTSIIQCNGIWVAGGKFGCNFKVVQMKVDPRVDGFKNYAFLDDDRLE